MITAEVKKEFQKAIAAIRKEISTEAGQALEYPKAMMTGQQMKKNTATVNCGNEAALSEKILQHPVFVAFCEKHHAEARAERIVYGAYYTQYQLRLLFLEAAPQITGVDLANDADCTALVSYKASEGVQQ